MQAEDRVISFGCPQPDLQLAFSTIALLLSGNVSDAIPGGYGHDQPHVASTALRVQLPRVIAHTATHPHFSAVLVHL